MQGVGKTAAAKHPDSGKPLFEAFCPPRQASPPGKHCAANPIGRLNVCCRPVGLRLVEPFGNRSK